MQNKVISVQQPRTRTGRLILVSRGRKPDFNPFPTTPKHIAVVVSNLIHSTEIAEFHNLGHLKSVKKENLPVLPDGYFWHKNEENWTIRKWDSAPEVLLDVDVYTHKGALAGYNVSVNKNLIEMFADTSIAPRKTGVRRSSYGGFSNKDFQNVSSGFTDTRGHGLAYKDSSDGKDKRNQVINSDENPRNYSPEKSTGKGGSYLGQSIRNHQLERYTRSRKGAYREVNEFSPTSEQVSCGLFVPSVKHMIRIMPKETSYAHFPQGQDYKLTGKSTKDIWTQNERNLQLIPRARVLDLVKPDLEEKGMDIEHGFFLTNRAVQAFHDEDKFDIGTQVYCGKNEVRVIVARQSTDVGFRYSFFEFKRLLHMPVAVYPGIGTIYNRIMREMDDSDRGYHLRFQPISVRLESVGKSLGKVSAFLKDQKEPIIRVLRGGSIEAKAGSPKQVRKSDILELSSKFADHLKKTKQFFSEAKRELVNYTALRGQVKSMALEILTAQILSDTQEGLSNEKVDDNCNRTLSDVCHLMQTHDRKTIESISRLLDEAEYHIRSAHQLLQPPKVSF